MLKEKVFEDKKASLVPSHATAISWSMFFMFFQLLTGMFDAYVVYFYNVNLKLPMVYVTAAIWIATLLGAINEPLIGYHSEKNTPFTRTIGKRRPWAIFGAFFAILGFTLYYLSPWKDGSLNPIPVFIWMCFMMVLYNTGLTMADVNVQSLFPDKFRTAEARRKVQLFVTPISLFALIAASVLPSFLLLNQDDASQYTKFALISAIVLAITFCCSIPGLKEEHHVIDRYFVTKNEDRENFVQSIKNCFKQRAFVMMVMMLLAYGLLIGSMLASMPYTFTYLIVADPKMAIVATACLVCGGMVSSAFWARMFGKINDNKKSFTICGICLGISAMLVGCTTSAFTAILYVTIYGCVMAAFWMLNPIMLADVYDERAVIYKTAERGAAVGIMQFMTRLSRLLMVSMVAIIHAITGFNPELATQSSIAQIGLRLQIGILPGLIFLLTLAVWTIYYPLNKKRTLEVQSELKKLNL